MKQTKIRRYPIEDLIPQRSPLICVDELISIDYNSATSSFLILSDFLFIKDRQITAAGLLENAAQTAAARSGYIQRVKNEKPILGFVTSFKNIEIFEYPNVNDQLISKIFSEQLVLNMSFFEINTFVERRLIMRGKIGVFLETSKT